ncbi:MAG TPA: hypothetical protein VII23_16195 [Terriglobales bacterium]
MIFLVGASPTAGIDRTQCEVALRLAQRFGKSDRSSEHPLTIVGPTFSGSLYSLSELLQNSAGHFSPIMIASAVGSGESVANFKAAMTDAGLEDKVNFASFGESSNALENALLKYACEQWRIWPRDVAFISETETAYGRQDLKPKDVCQKFELTPAQRTPLSRSFPRGIYHVRSAYEHQSSDGSVEGDGPPQVRTNLRPNLEEKRNGVDTVPNFSPQSAVSQDAVLMGVVDQLHRRHSQLVLVMASDPLDTLFLVRYLRKNYAYGRLVLVGPDLLLRHESSDPAVLAGAPGALDAALGLRRVGGNLLDAEFLQGASQLGGRLFASELFGQGPVGIVALEDAVAVAVEAEGYAMRVRSRSIPISLRQSGLVMAESSQDT